MLGTSGLEVLVLVLGTPARFGKDWTPEHLLWITGLAEVIHTAGLWERQSSEMWQKSPYVKLSSVDSDLLGQTQWKGISGKVVV